MMVYITWNYWGFGLCPSGILTDAEKQHHPSTEDENKSSF
jgi:hypothetical protein